MIETLREFILRELHWSGDIKVLTPDYALIDNHVIDSLGLFMMVSFVEQNFGVRIGDEELIPENFGSLGAIVNLVDRKQALAS